MSQMNAIWTHVATTTSMCLVVAYCVGVQYKAYTVESVCILFVGKGSGPRL